MSNKVIAISNKVLDFEKMSDKKLLNLYNQLLKEQLVLKEKLKKVSKEK